MNLLISNLFDTYRLFLLLSDQSDHKIEIAASELCLEDQLTGAVGHCLLRVQSKQRRQHHLDGGNRECKTQQIELEPDDQRDKRERK